MFGPGDINLKKEHKYPIDFFFFKVEHIYTPSKEKFSKWFSKGKKIPECLININMNECGFL